MQAKRLTLAAGVETAFEFDNYAANSVVVKNETAGEILFCDGPFDAAKAAHIPAFSWQALNVRVFPGEKPKFYVRAAADGTVEIDFGSSGAGILINEVTLSGSNAAEPFSGSSNTTKTFSKTMNGFVIVNDGLSDLTFTIGTDTYTVKPGECFDDRFEPFTEVTITTTVAFRAFGRC